MAKGAGLASAVLLLLVAAAVAHRPIDVPDVDESAVALGAHPVVGDVLRRRLLSVHKAIEQPIAYGTESVPDAHTRKMHQFIQGLIDKRREEDRLEHPGETDLQRFGRKAKKGLNFLMGTFSVVSAVGCFIPGLQFFCATTLLG